MAEKKFLKIAIVGKPNVGKSSLFNAIFNSKQMIVNAKPQTTRKPLSLYFKTDDVILEYVDTPGFHNPKNKLDTYLNNYVVNSFKDVDLIYLLLDPSRVFSDEDLELIQKIIKLKYNVFLVYTKSDLNKNLCILDPELKQQLKIVKEIKVCSAQNEIHDLMDATIKYAIENGEVVYDELFTDNQDDNFMISEIIREQCLNLLNDEIPYGVAVTIESSKYDTETNTFNIDACIAVEKENHKAIVIGSGGKMIKEIGTLSRKELLNIFDCKINLKLFVKVDKDWRNNLTKIKEYGYFN